MQVILCFGNEWHGDDGFGLAVYEALTYTSLPQNVEVYFCANNALMTARNAFEANRIIIVDAYQTVEHLAGELRWASGSQFIDEHCRNMHDGGVEEFIKHLPILCQSDTPPSVDVLYITVQPVTGFKKQLSPEISAQIEAARNILLESLQQEEVA